MAATETDGGGGVGPICPGCDLFQHISYSRSKLDCETAAPRRFGTAYRPTAIPRQLAISSAMTATKIQPCERSTVVGAIRLKAYPVAATT
jgi:hypothetical protein